MTRADSNDWIILRTRPAQTLRLVASLQDAGFAAWSPLDWQVGREPRGKAKVRASYALTPTYVFVPARCLDDMRRMERVGGTGHPGFSIMRYYKAVIYLRHTALHALRSQEQDSYLSSLPNSGKRYGKARGAPLQVGDDVTFDSGPFTGLPGYVESSDGRHTRIAVVLFGQRTGVTIETSRLRENGVAPTQIAA